jgi:hypothetical protein
MNDEAQEALLIKDRRQRMREIMDLEQIKYQTCPLDQEEGILLTDIEEIIPETDAEGDLQYYCLAGHHIFSLDENEEE